MSHGWIKERFLQDEAISIRSLDQSIEKRIRRTIVPAEMNALYTTPVEIVPAPGAGKVIVPFHALLWLEYNSIAYTGTGFGELILFRLGVGSIWAGANTLGFIDSTTDEYVVLSGPGGGIAGGVAEWAVIPNAPLVIKAGNQNFATGNSPLHVEVAYRILDTNIDVSLN